MPEKPPGDNNLSQPKAEHTETEDLETRRQAIASQLKTLIEEEQMLIARIDADESFSRLAEINREQTILIEQLGAIEREITAQHRSMQRYQRLPLSCQVPNCPHRGRSAP